MRSVSILAGGLAALAIAQAEGGDPPLYAYEGDAPGDLFGLAFAPAGDVDGDGFADFAIGAPAGEEGIASSLATGCVRVYSGRDGSLLLAFKGEPGARFGAAVAAAGDADGDGVVDLVVGRPGSNASTGAQAGGATVFSGKTGQVIRAVDGFEAGDQLGRSVVHAGDADLDGLADFAAGAPGFDKGGPDSGGAAVFSGASGQLLSALATSGVPNARLGTSIAALSGATTAAVLPDLVLGGPFAPGSIGTVQGAGFVVAFTSSGQEIWKASGVTPGDAFGFAIAAAAHLDDDDQQDLVVGAPSRDANEKDAGAVYLLRGTDGEILTVREGLKTSGQLGYAVAAFSDLDGDGFSDFAAGSPGTGDVAVISGANLETLHSHAGPEGFGEAVAALGDVNGDALVDVGIGSPREQNAFGDESAGRAIVTGAIEAAGPLLALDDVSPIDLVWEKGTPPPAPVQRLVLNTGKGTLNWQAEIPPGDAWLGVSPQAGVVPDASAQPVTISADPTSLPVGTYVSEVRFTNASDPANFVVVGVTLDVEPAPSPPDLCVDGPGSLLFEHTLGSPPPDPAAFEVTNCGNPDLPLPFEVLIVQGASWLGADVTGGTVVPGGSPIEVKVQAVVGDPLEAGVHQGLVRFQSTVDAADFFEVPVALVVEVASFEPGDRLVGSIEVDTDQDRAAFFGVQKMTLKLTMKQTGGLKPYVAILNAEGLELKRWNLKGKKKKWKKKWKVPLGGVYQVAIGPREPSTGAYEIDTGRKLPKLAKPKVWKHAEPKAGLAFVDIPIALLPGALLSANAIPHGVPTTGTSLQLITPTGEIYDIGAFSFSSSGMLHLVKAPINAPGTWHLRILGLEGGASATVQVWPIQPGKGASTVSIDS